ncbi:LOW QUALITY PROTEIN: glutaredoxin-related protein 5, mitochondrial [Spheniscus humboldti]
MWRRRSDATFPALRQAVGAGSEPAERGGGRQWARVGGRGSMSGVVRAAWRLGAAAARGRAGRPLSQVAAGGAEGGGAEGGGAAGSGSREAVERLVRAHPVVVFMKGSPAQPLCGFSNAVVQILRLHGVEDYRAHDVLQDPDLRQGIKNYSNWPTIPQVYLNGEFVGGCDILLQMHQNGDLVEELKKLGIRSALLDAKKDQDKK